MWACWPVWTVLLPQKRQMKRAAGVIIQNQQHLNYDRCEIKPGWWFKCASDVRKNTFWLKACDGWPEHTWAFKPRPACQTHTVQPAHISHSVIFSSQAWSCWPSECGGRWVWSPISLWRQRKAQMRHMFSSGPGPPSSSLACLAASPRAAAAHGCSSWSVPLQCCDALGLSWSLKFSMCVFPAVRHVLDLDVPGWAGRRDLGLHLPARGELIIQDRQAIQNLNFNTMHLKFPSLACKTLLTSKENSLDLIVVLVILATFAAILNLWSSVTSFPRSHQGPRILLQHLKWRTSFTVLLAGSGMRLKRLSCSVCKWCLGSHGAFYTIISPVLRLLCVD